MNRLTSSLELILDWTWILKRLPAWTFKGRINDSRKTLWFTEWFIGNSKLVSNLRGTVDNSTDSLNSMLGWTSVLNCLPAWTFKGRIDDGRNLMRHKQWFIASSKLTHGTETKWHTSRQFEVGLVLGSKNELFTSFQLQRENRRWQEIDVIQAVIHCRQQTTIR